MREKLDQQIGARYIFDAICEARKPVVGHNCYLDLAHIFQKFLGPLPDHVDKFTRIVHEHFPLVLDTKLLLSSDSVLYNAVAGRTSLGDAYHALAEQKSSTASSNSSSSSSPPSASSVPMRFASDYDAYADPSGQQHHEAGYDAYMTGSLLLHAANATAHSTEDFRRWCRGETPFTTATLLPSSSPSSFSSVSPSSTPPAPTSSLQAH